VEDTLNIYFSSKSVFFLVQVTLTLLTRLIIEALIRWIVMLRACSKMSSVFWTVKQNLAKLHIICMS